MSRVSPDQASQGREYWEVVPTEVKKLGAVFLGEKENDNCETEPDGPHRIQLSRWAELCSIKAEVWITVANGARRGGHEFK